MIQDKLLDNHNAEMARRQRIGIENPRRYPGWASGQVAPRDFLEELNAGMREKHPDWDAQLEAARIRFREAGGLASCTITDVTDLILGDRYMDVRLRSDVQ